jgi:MATE family multidrug resistance protein
MGCVIPRLDPPIESEDGIQLFPRVPDCGLPRTWFGVKPDNDDHEIFLGYHIVMDEKAGQTAISPAPRLNSLTIGSLWENIWRISWPMFLIMVFSFLVGFADVYVAGFIGPEVQAAVGFISQLYFLITIIANAISIGTLALISRAVGSGDTKRAVAVARQSLILSLLIAAAITAVCLLFYRGIVSFAGFPAGTRIIAEKFLRIFALSLGPNYILIISNAIFRATGEVKKPLLAMFLVSLVNIAGDFVLVFGIPPFPKMGYAGIAVSTAASVTAGMAISLLLFTIGWWRSLYSERWKVSAETVVRIIRLGWPAAMLQIAWNAGTIVLYNILGRLGEASITAMASITNGLRIEAIIYLPAFALNMTASVLVGQNLGAEQPDRAEKAGWKISQVGVVFISLLAVAIFIFAEGLASLLTSDPSVVAETTRYLRFNMLSEPFMALSVVLGGGLQGAGDTKGTMWVIIIGMWFVRLPLAYAFALVLGYGATGVWAAMITSMAFQGILMAIRFRSGHWKKLRVE